MRPVQLSMQAFGPYAGRETVDFRNAVASGLFGIYGPTGSGKSSIFNAMMFALFGEATKEKFETNAFRSGHAEAALPTEVELVFEIGDKTYLVRRRPDQMRPKQRGAGETKVAHEAWLFDVTGLPVEVLSETNTGKILAEKKVGEVDAAVVRLLGYGASQFRQIVLLPQGKFEAFLAANTKDRLSILRQLFDVSIYKRLSERLKEDAKAAEDRVKTANAVCDQLLLRENFASPEALCEGIAESQTILAERTQREAEAAETVARAHQALDAERQIDTLFITAAKAAAELETLHAKDEAIQHLVSRVANARRAQALADVERQWHTETAALAEADDRQKQTIRLVETAETAANTAFAVHESEKARTGEIDTLRKRGEDLDRHQETLASASGLEAKAREDHVRLADLARKLHVAAGRVATLQTQKRDLETALKTARDQQSIRQSLTARHVSLTTAFRAAKDYEKADLDYASARLVAEHSRTALAEAAANTAIAKTRFEQAEQNLARVQALHLATKLIPGHACPVCGALDHPAPAGGDIHDAGLNDAFKTARAELDAAQTAEQAAGRHLASAEATLAERNLKWADLAPPETSSAELSSEISAVHAKIAALGPMVDLAAMDARIADIDAALTDAEQARDTLRESHEAAAQDHVRALSRWESALETIPEPMRNRDTLTHARNDTRRALATRQTALAAAEQQSNATREALLAARKDQEAAGIARESAARRRDLAHTAFAERLDGSGLSEVQYQAFKALISQIESDQARIDEHTGKLAIARHKNAEAQLAIAGRIRPKLAPVEAAFEEAKAALHQAMTDRTTADIRCRSLLKLQHDIAAELLRIEQVKADAAPLLELAGQFNAGNRDKLDLETFAIGEMFTEVLEAANLRYAPMTSGRYAFHRAAEEATERSRRGLGIAIFDVFTGKFRAPATLSGGETFIAALALALGLSDVVESMSGNVRLDTIFIDEGFGSLDTEATSGTLDVVLNVLRTLVSQNRAVGLISHVPQVQEAIPNGFYIRKETRGSRVELREAL